MPPANHAALLVASGLGLVGFGKSGDARKAEAVKCGALFQNYLEATLGGDTLLKSFVKQVNAAAVGHPADDGLKLQGLVSLGEQVAPQVEAVKREAAQQDGLQDVVKFVRAKDANGAVSYRDECVDNRDRLLASAR